MSGCWMPRAFRLRSVVFLTFCSCRSNLAFKCLNFSQVPPMQVIRSHRHRFYPTIDSWLMAQLSSSLGVGSRNGYLWPVDSEQGTTKTGFLQEFGCLAQSNAECAEPLQHGTHGCFHKAKSGAPQLQARLLHVRTLQHSICCQALAGSSWQP